MDETLPSPYVKGNTLTLKVDTSGRKNDTPLPESDIGELQAKIIDIIEPSTMSVVLLVELAQKDETAPALRAILKVYDRQFSPELREFEDMGLATSGSEDEFVAFVRQGSMPQFLKDHNENGAWAYDEWDVPKLEAYSYAASVQKHEIELEIYNRLFDMQGVHVPTVFANVKLAPKHATEGREATDYTEIRALLLEYIPGFPLHDIVTEVPESDWAPICDQAIEVIREIVDNDFINFDIKLRNSLVRRNSEGSYQVFYLDFGECQFRDPSDSDEIWRERKRQQDEEGAVGYMMMNKISYAKGKKGKKYKGNLPLPWEYKPSSRFEGPYIELYESVE